MKKKRVWIAWIVVGVVLFNPLSVILGVVIVAAVDYCYWTSEQEGMDYYFQENKHIGDVELTYCWIPNETDFWRDFKYDSAIFHWSINKLTESCIMVLNYDQSTYSDVKSFLFEYGNYSEVHRYDYGTTSFVENLELPNLHRTVKNGENSDRSITNWVGVNDEKNTAVFIGLKIGSIENKDMRNITSQIDFNYGVERYFGPYLSLL